MIQAALLPLLLLNSQPATTAKAEDSFTRWEQRLRNKVSRLHVVPASANDVPACDVTISFPISADGRPGTATIRQSSCQPFHERASRRLVRDLGRIGRVPSLSGKDHNVVLKLSYGRAPTEAEDRLLTAALEAERLANARRNVELVSFTRSGTVVSNSAKGY